jgi:hypothetical protein
MGIRLVVGSAYSLDMSDYDFTGVDDAEITKFTSSTIKGTAGLFALTVKGSGFSHDQLGYLTGGTIESVSLTYHHESILSLSGAHVSVEKLIDVLSSASSSDDIALLKSTLGGDDYISGSQYGDYINAYGGNDTLLGRDGSDKIRGARATIASSAVRAATICTATVARTLSFSNRYATARQPAPTRFTISAAETATGSTCPRSTPMRRQAGTRRSNSSVITHSITKPESCASKSPAATPGFTETRTVTVMPISPFISTAIRV